MKKIGLVLAACLCLNGAMAQTVIDIYSTGAMGSYTTGSSTMTTRADNTIAVQSFGPTRRGYAVFDLATIPATAVVTSVELHFNKETVTGFPGGGAYTTRGWAGDLSSVTVAATLFANMGAGTTIFTSSYGTTAGNTFLPNEATAVAFIGGEIGNKVSVAWTTTTPRVFAITGEVGVQAISGVHAPYLRVTYDCPGITSISASPPATSPCPNTPFTLTGAAAGSIASYSWVGPLGFSSTALSPTVPAGLPSSGVYTFSVTDASGCSANTTTMVTVFTPPSSVVTPLTPTAFCDGDSARLDVAVSLGGTYQWYDSGTPIAGATSETFWAHGTGNFKVQVTDANGCTSTSSVGVPTILLANPPVSPVGPVLLCQGDNGTITVNTNGVTSVDFQWQKDGVDIPGAVGPSHVAAASGVYRVVVSVPSSGCSTTSLPVTVDVNSYPLPTVSYSGNVLSAVGTYVAYQWFLNTIAIAGATTSTITPTIVGNYRVRVTDGNGCTAFSSGFAVNAVGVGMLNAASTISLFPNPVKETLRIASPVPVSAVISSIEGKVISRHDATNEIDIHNLPAGLYLVTIYNEAGDRIKVEKITKQ